MSYIDEQLTRYEIMMGHLPSFYQVSPQMNNIQEALSLEIENILMLQDKLISETFLDSSESEIGRYERILNIKQKVGDSIDLRRERLISRLSSQPPININQVKNIVNSYITSGASADVQELPGEYAFIVMLPPSANYDYGSITDALEYAKPAHLEAIYSTSVTENVIGISISSFIESIINFRPCNTFACGEDY